MTSLIGRCTTDGDTVASFAALLASSFPGCEFGMNIVEKCM